MLKSIKTTFCPDDIVVIRFSIEKQNINKCKSLTDKQILSVLDCFRDVELYVEKFKKSFMSAHFYPQPLSFESIKKNVVTTTQEFALGIDMFMRYEPVKVARVLRDEFHQSLTDKFIEMGIRWLVCNTVPNEEVLEIQKKR